MAQEHIIDLFMKNAAAADAEPMRVKDRAQLAFLLSHLLESGGSIYCPRATEIEKELVLPGDRLVEDYALAEVCVEEASAGIAETGSLAFSSAKGKPVQAGLLPPHHIALLSAENIHESLDDFFSLWGSAPPANLTLETGPSRTADIELTLTIGVHGPQRLTIIVF
jgi:L-lactate dehydrogenase complex protein LldG